jgi:copper chaperone CopZ
MSPNEVEQIHISIPGLDERGSDAVERQLSSLPGVTEVTVLSERVRVTVDATIVSDDELLAAIDQFGYDARLDEE